MEVENDFKASSDYQVNTTFKLSNNLGETTRVITIIPVIKKERY
jgi:hypothetical protein